MVIDNGSYEVRVGLAGDEAPRYVAPNCTARPRQQLRVLVADEIYSIKNQAQLEVTRPLERGVLTNAGCQREVWQRCLERVGCGEARDARLVVTECALAPPSAQRAMDELIFEDFGFLGRCRPSAPQCVGAAAAELFSRRSSGAPRASGKGGDKEPDDGIGDVCMVVDCGHAATTASPVVSGYLVGRGVRRLDVGGHCLSGYVRDLVSFRQMNMMDEIAQMDSIKKALCFVADDFEDRLDECDGTTKERGAAGPHYAEYVLPDFHSIDEGYARLDARSPGPEEDGAGAPVRRRRTPADRGPQFVRLESERFCAPELLFSPMDIGLKQCGVHELIADALLACDPVLRAPLARRVVLCGGTARLPGLAARLAAELRPLVPEYCDLDLIETRNDPDHLAFHGAAILAKGPENFLARADYLEHGADRFLTGWHPYHPDVHAGLDLS